MFQYPRTKICPKGTNCFNTPILNLNSLNLQRIYFWNTAKNTTHFRNFSANICVAPFLDAQELHSRSTLKANVCILLYNSIIIFLFQRLRKLLTGGRLNNFFKAARSLSLVKFFILIEIFGNPTIF